MSPAAAPIPPLVATARLESSQIGPLQDALRQAGEAAELTAEAPMGAADAQAEHHVATVLNRHAS